MKTLLRSAVVALFYFAVAWLGMTSANYSDRIAIIWPASGFSVAVLWILGLRYWPVIYLADLAFFTTIVLTENNSLHPGMLLTAGGNAFGPLVGVWLRVAASTGIPYSTAPATWSTS